MLRAAKDLSDAATKATLDDFAPNKISAGTRSEIVRLAHEGKGIRAIARELGISKTTVDRYFPRDAKCACGRLLIDHRGWCAVRFAASKARQEVLAGMHERHRK